MDLDLDLALLPTTVSASASASRKKLDVFISFRGEDTRKNFMSHLHAALLREKIETYVDDRLVRGEEISQSLLEAIEDSQVSVVIFSQNYASSSWCLDELAHILHCKENNKQIVLPVFYHVTPSDVRKQQGAYAAALAKFEERYNDKIIYKWRTALTTAASLSGYDASNTRNDHELIESIVKDIIEKLNYTSSNDHLVKGLVGIDKYIEDVKSLLSHAPTVGIWGMGGLGKTTLAKVVFKQFHPHFEGYCFLANVRENREIYGATYLQKLFWGELSKEKVLDMVNLQSVKQKLYRKKLLIVLDDVDDFEQYELLIEDWDWLNSESRVIITSRDQQVLQTIKVKAIYNLKELNDEEALQLFCLHAFRRKFPVENDAEMSTKFVNYAQGVPLALKVLGSHLYSKSKKEWASALNKLKVVPNKKILDVLKVSFDGLDHIQKEIFLDIACFFQGKSKDFVEKILDDGGCFAIVIRDLIDKSLVTVDNINKLWMHDLLQEMGWEIARGHKESGERLWSTDCIYYVLKNNAGTNTIEGIFLDDIVKKNMYSKFEVFENHEVRDRVEEDIDLEPDVFQKMASLRLLKIHSISCQFHCHQGLHSFPDKLRYLDWHYYPLESLGSHFTPRNLVHLSMPYSRLKKLWNEFPRGPENLEYVNLHLSETLTYLPDLSRANLKTLLLSYCTSLVELPPVRFQNIVDDITEEETKVTNDHDYVLNLRGCSNLRTLSEISGNIKYLLLDMTAIEELCPSIGSLYNLVSLHLEDCKCLKNLPSSICNLGSLEYLNLSGCSSLDKFPELPKNVRSLNLSGTSIEQVVPSSFTCLPHLNILYMDNCTRLESLPTSICKLKSLTELHLSHCSNLECFPEILEPIENLEDLALDGTGIKEIPSSVENLVALETLNLSHCKNLEFLPTNICYMFNLRSIYVDEGPRHQNFPHYSLPLLPALDSSRISTGKLPFCIDQTLRESKCKDSCAGKSLFLCWQKSFHVLNSNIMRMHYCYKYWTRFTYCECLMFYTVHKILMTQYFHDRILRGKLQKSAPRMSFCYSGNKIPRWFTYQSMGSSIQVNFSPLQQDAEFLGFA
ncbi:TIR-NBS-LRR-like protein [Trema orientale]|uniref:ADP-ribosyl cyclase/cyclic ADP-ribose hydrolase n=1 Tax=Trema orientale TaxID=63057 RepID=A0A2P5BB86_TREOI|nr:TIR-NBS-LRR-like protein [Trema orientale]